MHERGRRYESASLVTPIRITAAPLRWSGPLAESRYQPGDRAAKWSPIVISQLAVQPATNSADPTTTATDDAVRIHDGRVAKPSATDSPRCMAPCIRAETWAVTRCLG